MHVRAKCRPKCASNLLCCVHVTALLFTLAELSPAACTSLPCALVCKNFSCSRGKSLSSVANLVSHSSLSYVKSQITWKVVRGVLECEREREMLSLWLLE